MPTLRLATAADVPALRALIDASVRALSVGYYTPAQIDSALRYGIGLDSQLIADGTYYLIEEGGVPVASGGWSDRRLLYGGDQLRTGEDPRLDPATDAARIRAFFVHPAWTRRGLARRLFDECVAAARAAGFRELELAATLPGVPLYRALGFTPREPIRHTLPDGAIFEGLRMTRPVDPAE